jgi:DNA-binding CsgD family transcriptional regulator
MAIWRSLFVLYTIFLLAIKISQGQVIKGIPFVRNFKTEEFKGGIQTWQITQTQNDLIYFANNHGLLEFDGNAFNIYPIKAGTKVRALHPTPDKIFVGCQREFGYFASEKNGNLKYCSLSDSLLPNERNFEDVWRIFEMDNAIYFISFRKIFKYENNSLEIIKPELPLESSFFVNNQIITKEAGKGLSILKNKEFQLLDGSDFFKDISVAAILPYLQKDKLLILTYNSGIYIYDLNSSTVSSFKVNELIISSIINNAILLNNGNIAIGTQNNGLIIMDRNGNLVLQISKDSGLSDRTVHSLFNDISGNMWLGLNNGLGMVQLSSPFSLLDEKVGIQGSGYAAHFNDGKLYLGTNNGLFVSESNTDNWKKFKILPRTSGQVYSIHSYNEQILVGHHNGTFLIKDSGPAELISQELGAWTFKPVPGKNNYIIGGNYYGLNLFKWENNKWKFHQKIEGFDESSRVIEFDSDNKLWMTHGYKGVFNLDLDIERGKINKVQYYNQNDGFPSDILIDVSKIGNKLLFPAEFGVYKFAGNRNMFEKEETLSSYFLPDEHIIKLSEDILGKIYFVSDKRIGVLKPTGKDNYEIFTDQFHRIFGQLNDDLGNIHVIDPQNILFGAKEGFILYNPDNENLKKDFKTYLRKVTFTSIKSDSILYLGTWGGNADNKNVSLPYSLNSLRFNFAAAFYENFDQTQYQFFLENFDQDWSEWNFKTEKEYTNLPEGDYIFHVRAKNIYNTMSNTSSYRFTIEPPFYRSPIAYFFYIFLGIGSLGLFYGYLNKSFLKEKKKIISDQNKVLNQKEVEIKEITEQSAKEIFQLKNEKLLAEVELMNKELTSSTLHLINKNEFLNSLKSSLQTLIKEKNIDGVNRIIKQIDQNISSDEDWKQFETHFNAVYNEFTTRLLDQYQNLTPQEIKLCAFLRLNLNTKEIAHLLNISVRGVEICRYRLRKKLDLDRNVNLTDFILKY